MISYKKNSKNDSLINYTFWLGIHTVCSTSSSWEIITEVNMIRSVKEHVTDKKRF